MYTGTISSTINVGGATVVSEQSRQADAQVSINVALPGGKAGTLSTRTDDDTGVATLAAEHGITTADRVNVAWAGGMRYGCTVTDVSGTDVTVDLGAGDNLPAADTAIVVTPRVTINLDVDGDDVQILAVHSTKRAHVEFLTPAPASLVARELVANEAWSWVTGTGAANPLAGDPVGSVEAAAGGSDAATLQIVVLYDSTP